MNTIDMTEILARESREKKLRVELFEAQRNIARLLGLCKLAHMHTNDDGVAICLAVAIRDLDPLWAPELRRVDR